jgi:hypothetical protein
MPAAEWFFLTPDSRSSVDKSLLVPKIETTPWKFDEDYLLWRCQMYFVGPEGKWCVVDINLDSAQFDDSTITTNFILEARQKLLQAWADRYGEKH